MNTITKRAIELWQKVPADQRGLMPHSYNIRCKLYEEFGNTHEVDNCAQAAIRIIKRGSPLTTTQKQMNRNTALNEAAQIAGWLSWSSFETAVINHDTTVTPANNSMKPTTNRRQRGRQK